MRHLHAACSALFALTLLVHAPDGAMAQVGNAGGADPESRLTLRLHGGAFLPQSGGELFQFVEERLGVSSGDLRGAAVGAEVAWRLGDRWHWFIGTDASRSQAESEAGSGQARQKTTIETGASAYLGARVDVLPGSVSDGGRRWKLLVGGGGGVVPYRFAQTGSFPDESRPGSTFEAQFESNGSGTFRFLGAGMQRSLGRGLGAFADVRYQAGDAAAAGDFRTFEPIDLSGTRVSLGLSLELGR